MASGESCYRFFASQFSHHTILARSATMTDDVAVSTEIQVDDETRAALLLFNERVEADAANERGRKRIAKAERAKTEAAKKVRQVNDDPDATAEQKAEAEAEYKAAQDHYLVVEANPLAAEQKPIKAKEPAPPPAEEPAPAEEPPPAEVSADEEEDSASKASDEGE